MFCLMDVSGSMTEDMKDLAKRFYTLLYLFLKRRYKHVELVFIRHTHEAKEVDEETFFHSRETGGTVVSTALEEMRKVVEARYPPGRLEHLRRAGLRRRQHRRRQRADRAAAARHASCRSASTSPISRSAARTSTARPASRRGQTDLWRTYEQLRRRRRAAGDAQGAPPPRHLPGLPRAVPRRRATAGMSAKACTPEHHRATRLLYRGRRLGFRHAPPHPRRLRGDRARRAAASTSIPTRSRSSPPSRCSTPMPRSACRCSTGTGPSASTSPSTRRSTARACAAWPTRSSSTPTPASATSWRRTPRRCRRW